MAVQSHRFDKRIAPHFFCATNTILGAGVEIGSIQMLFALKINTAKVGGDIPYRYKLFFDSIKKLGVTLDQNNRLDIPSEEILEKVRDCVKQSGIPEIKLELIKE